MIGRFISEVRSKKDRIEKCFRRLSMDYRCTGVACRDDSALILYAIYIVLKNRDEI